MPKFAIRKGEIKMLEGNELETGVDSVETAGFATGNEEVDNDVVVNEEGSEEVESTEQEETAESGQASEGVETSKAFAERLRKKTEQVEQQYKPYLNFIEKEAKKYGMTPQEYLQVMEEQHAEEEKEKQLEADRQKYGDLPEEVLEKVKKADELVAKEAQREQMHKEAAALKKAFPNIKSADEIPDEVFLMRDQQKIPLDVAYKAYLFDHQNSEQAKIDAEQAAIRKLQQASSSSPGFLGGGAVNNEKSIKDISDADFEKMIQAVKNGEKIIF